MRGEEVTLLAKMLAEGHEGWWGPGVKVRHYIPKSRQTRRYLRGYFFGQGEHDAMLTHDNGEPKLFGRPRWVWRQAIEADIKYRFRCMLGRPEVWIEDLKTASHGWGLLHGYTTRESD